MVITRVINVAKHRKHKVAFKDSITSIFGCADMQREFWKELSERLRKGESPYEITTMKRLKTKDGKEIIVVE